MSETGDAPAPEDSGRGRAAQQVATLIIILFIVFSVLYSLAVATNLWPFLLATDLGSLIALPVALVAAFFLLAIHFTRGSIDTVALGIRIRGFGATLTLLILCLVTSGIAVKVLWVDDAAWKVSIHQQLERAVGNDSKPQSSN